MTFSAFLVINICVAQDVFNPKLLPCMVLVPIFLLWTILTHRSSCPCASFSIAAKREGRGLFAPRVEYDEWTPLGHGDPLKNDPTYDYVPPVLERVRYWIEPSTPHRQPPPTATPPHYRQPPPTASPPHHHHHHQNTYRQPPPPNTYARPPRPQAATSQYNSAERRDNHPFLTLVDGPKFNLPPSPPYKQTPPRQQYTRPPYRSPPPRPTFTTPAPTTEVTTTGAPSLSWSYQQTTTTSPITTTTTTPASPIFLTPAEISAPPTTEGPTPTPRPLSTSYTTSASLTTDPLFAHYKQPSEPLQGPMYLIIEGHSKVKNYGAGKQQPSSGGSGASENRSQKRRKRKKRRLRSFLYNFL